MNIEFHFLADQKQHLPQLAQWYFAEWGELTQAASVHIVEARLQEYLNSDKIPLIIVASSAGELVGAVQLKFREMTNYPEKEHWIGGVYVAEKFRGKVFLHPRAAEPPTFSACSTIPKKASITALLNVRQSSTAEAQAGSMRLCRHGCRQELHGRIHAVS